MVKQISGDYEEGPLTVFHYHYRKWPRNGVPKSSSLLNFILHVRHSRSGLHPILVHCSTGVGRTGVYIALDSMLNCIEQAESINVYSFVRDMRGKRMQMVQTKVCSTKIRMPDMHYLISGAVHIYTRCFV